ncbi:MAG: shikimate kinase [Lysobacteraceae bacterium]|nr:MAG: shikimate kinase [Xanthomonadaceae bacterium]
MRNDAFRRHVVLVGPMGSGKSTLGPVLAARLGLDYVDVDAAIMAAAGREIASIFATEGEAGFRDREARALAGALAGNPAVIATGGGAVLAQANRAAMRGAGTVVYLFVEPATQLSRLAGDRDRPLLQGDDRAATLAALQAVREPLYRAAAHHLFDTSALDPDAAAAALAKLLARDEAIPA